MITKSYSSRSIFLFIIVFSLLACAAPPSLPPSSSISKVKFISDIPAGALLGLAVGPDSRLFTAQKDGSIVIIDRQGKQRIKLLKLPAINDQGLQILKRPSHVTISKDKIYVTDTALNQVILYSLDGTWLDSFGSRGSGFKEFKTPLGIAVYQGVIFVADSGNRRIQIFGPNGVYLRSIGPVVADKSEGSKNPLKKKSVAEGNKKPKIVLRYKPIDAASKKPRTISLQNPTDVAVDHQGFIYVVDEGNNTVKIFNQIGNYLGKLPNVKRPSAISLGRDGFYLADQESFSILKYDFDGNLLYTFGNRGRATGQFGSITDIALDHTGRIYVADAKRGLIHEFFPDQDVAYSPAQKVSPPTSVKWVQEIPISASQIAFNGIDILYAADGKSLYRVKSGRFEKIPIKNEISPIAVAASKDGVLWVLDGNGKQVVKTDSTGKILETFRLSTEKIINWFSKPRDIVVTRKGVVYVADPGNKWIWVLAFKTGGTPSANLIRRDKDGNDLESPAALALDEEDNLYVLDDKKIRIHVYSSAGKPIASFGTKGKTGGGMIRPVDFFVSKDEVIVLDAGTSSVKVFRSDGTFIREFGAKGSGKGDFKNPTAITAKDKITFFVADTGNKRIQILGHVYTPKVPSEVVATGGMHKVEITWQPSPEKYPLTYRIYRSDGPGGPISFLATTGHNRYVDRKVDLGRKLFYRVSAQASGGKESSPSLSAGAQASAYTPQAPQQLKAEASQWSVDLSWKPNDENFVIQYVIYRQTRNEKYEIGKAEYPRFSDRSLSPDTEYTYLITAISSDGEESSPGIVATRTKIAKKAPIEITVLEMQDIFSNAYKIYEDEGFGRIRIRNNFGDTIPKLTLHFTIKEFMDFPSEIEMEDLAPGESRDYTLKAVFNNKILEVTEDTPVQTEIKASYYLNDQPREFTRNYAINIYEKHRMMWSTRERFAAFITPKDPVLLEFVRTIVTQYGQINSNMLRAATVFNAIGELGLTYIQDPNNPYQITSGKTDFVDYLQYPRETLKRKSGDCDDLVALYAGALESMGISTHAVEIPGHMLMMFSTGVEAEQSSDTLNNLFVVYKGQLWAPIETTLVGSSFMKAWEKGSTSYYQWRDSGLTTIDIREAWRRFKPASLPASNWRPSLVRRTAIEERFPGDFGTLKRIELKLRSRKYYKILSEAPNDTHALMQIGIIFGKADVADEAFRAFEKILEKNAENASALNNKANVLLMNRRYEDASNYYEKAAALDSKDPLIWVNLARSYLRLKRVEKAKNAFRKAFELDSGVSMKYRMMSLELLTAF